MLFTSSKAFSRFTSYHLPFPVLSLSWEPCEILDAEAGTGGKEGSGMGLGVLTAAAGWVLSSLLPPVHATGGHMCAFGGGFTHLGTGLWSQDLGGPGLPVGFWG